MQSSTHTRHKQCMGTLTCISAHSYTSPEHKSQSSARTRLVYTPEATGPAADVHPGEDFAWGARRQETERMVELHELQR